MFEWMQGNTYNMLVTIYPSNITLNNAAANHFKDSRFVLVGFSSNGEKMAIKPISKDDIEKGIVKLENLHKISIGKGYGRISNKMLICEIKKHLPDIDESQKLSASFNEKEKMLIVNLKEGDN